jgi:chromosome partitioning protein
VGRAIAVFSGKGGVGKSTLAVNLAVLSGSTLLDADPQCSAAIWGDRRVGQPEVIEVPIPRVAARIAGLESVVVDMPGALVGGAIGVMGQVDLVLVPIVPDFAGFDVLPQTLDLLKPLSTPVALVVNRLHPRANLDDYTTVLSQTKIAIAPTAIRERAQHRDLWGEGRVAADEPQTPAGQDVTALWQWIQEQFYGHSKT